MAVTLAPVPSEQDRATCPSCSAPLAPDQRYCLTCGQPVSPVLGDLVSAAFLDVLQPEPRPYAPGQSPAMSVPAGYVSVMEPSSGAYPWLRRYSGLFGLLTVLLMSIIVGLLVGHWITQKQAPGQQVIKVEGLTGATPLAAAAAPASTATSTTPQPAAATKSEAKAEAAEAKEAKAIEKAPTPPPVKVTATKLQKLGSTTGRKHEEELNKLGAQPIETGG